MVFYSVTWTNKDGRTRSSCWTTIHDVRRILSNPANRIVGKPKVHRKKLFGLLDIEGGDYAKR